MVLIHSPTPLTCLCHRKKVCRKFLGVKKLIRLLKVYRFRSFTVAFPDPAACIVGTDPIAYIAGSGLADCTVGTGATSCITDSGPAACMVFHLKAVKTGTLKAQVGAGAGSRARAGAETF